MRPWLIAALLLVACSKEKPKPKPDLATLKSGVWLCRNPAAALEFDEDSFIVTGHEYRLYNLMHDYFQIELSPGSGNGCEYQLDAAGGRLVLDCAMPFGDVPGDPWACELHH